MKFPPVPLGQHGLLEHRERAEIAAARRQELLPALGEVAGDDLGALVAPRDRLDLLGGQTAGRLLAIHAHAGVAGQEVEVELSQRHITCQHALVPGQRRGALSLIGSLIAGGRRLARRGVHDGRHGLLRAGRELGERLQVLERRLPRRRLA